MNTLRLNKKGRAIEFHYFDSKFVEVEKDGEWIEIELTGFDTLSSRLQDYVHFIKVGEKYEEVHHKYFIKLYEEGRVR